MTISASLKTRMIPLFVVLLAVLFAPLGAYAQTTAAPSGGGLKLLPTQWSKRCFKQGKNNVCLTLIDRYVARADGKPIWIAAAALREVAGQKNKSFTVRVPLGVFLRNGVTYAVDKGKAKRAPFSVCTRQGCQAIFPASPALLKSLKKGGELRLQVTGSNGKNVQIGIDLKGFTKANKSVPLPAPEQAVGQVRPAKPPLRKSSKGDAPSQ